MHPTTFEYLKPADAQLEQMAKVHEAASLYGLALYELLPEGRDTTYVIRMHRQTFVANMAVTRLPDGTPRT
jgi:hypothetical protein